MSRYLLIGALLALATTTPTRANAWEYTYYPAPDTMWAFVPEAGSYWIYEDALSNATDTVVVLRTHSRIGGWTTWIPCPISRDYQFIGVYMSHTYSDDTLAYEFYSTGFLTVQLTAPGALIGRGGLDIQTAILDSTAYLMDSMLVGGATYYHIYGKESVQLKYLNNRLADIYVVPNVGIVRRRFYNQAGGLQHDWQLTAYQFDSVGWDVLNVPQPTHEANVQLYPNPTANAAQLTLAEPARENLQLILIDSRGQLVQQDQIMRGAASARLPVDKLPRATYFVIIRGREFRLTKKLVVQ